MGSKKRKRPREGVDDAEGSPRKRQRADKTPESKAAEVLSQGKKHKLDEFTKVMGTKSNTRPAWAADIGPDVLDRGKTKGSQKRTAQDIDGTKKKGKENVQESEESPILGDQEPEEVSDMEWMRRRMVSSEIKEDKAFEQSDDESMKGGREADEKVYFYLSSRLYSIYTSRPTSRLTHSWILIIYPYSPTVVYSLGISYSRARRMNCRVSSPSTGMWNK